MTKDGNDIVFELDNSGGFTNINKITYKDAEFIADKFEEVTGINIAPTNLLFDKNQLADDLLDDYQEYQFLLNSYDENTRSMVISFYHHLFYNRRVPHDTVQILLNALSAFIQYACGSINKKNLKKQKQTKTSRF